MPCFFFYNLTMTSAQKSILNIAHKQLHELERISKPTWQDFEQMSYAISIIKYYEQDMCIDTNDLSEAIETMRTYYGDTKTLDIIERVLLDFKKDIDCVSPHIANCLIEKIKNKGE